MSKTATDKTEGVSPIPVIARPSPGLRSDDLHKYRRINMRAEPKSVILIQNSASSLGGVETLVARIAKEVLARGAAVTILILQDSVSSTAIRTIPDGCRIVFVNKPLWKDWLFPRGFWAAYWHDLLPPACDYLISFSPSSAMVMRLLRRSRFPGAAEFVYVVHPKMLDCDSDENPPYAKVVIDSLNLDSVFFMNPACRDEHATKGLTRFASCDVVPLPVEPFMFSVAQLRIPRKIVSVGRVQSGFKSYNWTFIRPFAAIANAHDLTWEIYGGGEKEAVASLKHAIAQAGMEDRIFHKGEISYDRMADAMDGSFAFVGMGTAAVESASMGLPTIVATAYSEGPTSHGLIQDVPFPCLGEAIAGHQERGIGDLLLELLELDEAGISEVRRASRIHAEKFSITAFCDYLEQKYVDVRNLPSVSVTQIIQLAVHYAWSRLATRLRRRPR